MMIDDTNNNNNNILSLILINSFGPMIRTWCMRYEAKHRYFKKIAMNMGNFTNVALTLAERHQMQSCYFMSASEEDQESRFLYKPNIIGKLI